MKNRNIKKILYITVSLSMAMGAQAQGVGVNATGAIPHSSSILDMNTGNIYPNPNAKASLPSNAPLTGITVTVTTKTYTGFIQLEY